MNLSILRFLAVGLAGLNVAVAGPCKPRSSASESSIATTARTSSFTLSSDTSATFASTTTEAVTTADTTTEATTEVTSAVTEIDTATGSAISTETTTSDDVTTEATTFATSTATTEATSTTGADTTTEAVTTSSTVTASSEITQAPTTTEETTTAAATTTAVPMFRLLPASSIYQGQPLLSNRAHFAPLLFNSAQSYTDAYFTVDTTTGRLLLDGTLPICGFFPGDGTSAFMVCDATNMPAQEQYLTCETPTPGSQLECTVPEVQCSMFSGCTSTGTLWGTTYIGPSGGDVGIKALLGPQSMPGYTPVPLLVTFDSD